MNAQRGSGGWGRRLGIVAAALVVLAGAGTLVLRAMLTPERLRASTIRAVQDATGLATELGDARLSLSPFGVTLTDLRVLGEGGAPLATMESGLARLSLLPLLRREVVVPRVSLVRPALFLSRDETGLVIPGRAAREAAAGERGGGAPPAALPLAASLRVAVQSFEILDGTVRVAGPDGDVALEGIELSGNLDVETGARSVRSEGQLSLERLSLTALDAYRETLERLKPVLRYRIEAKPLEGRVLLPELRLTAPPLDLAVQGEIDGLPRQPRASLTLAPAVYELRDLLALIPPAMLPEGRAPDGSGPVRLAAKLEGLLSDPARPPRVEWSMDFEGASFGWEGIPAGISDLRGSVVGTATEVILSDLGGKLGGDGTFRVSGRADSLATEGGPALDLAVMADIPLALAGQSGTLPPGVALGGRAKVDARARGRAAVPGAFALDGRIDVVSARAETPDLPVPAEDWNLSGVFAGSDLRIERARGRLGSATFEGRGVVRDVLGEPSIELDGRCARLDLVELAPPRPVAAPSSPAGSPGATPPAPPAEVALPLVPVMPPIPLTLHLVVDSLITEGARMAGVTLDAKGSGGAGDVTARIASADYGGVLLRGFDTNLALQGQTARGDFRAPEVDAYGSRLTGVTGTIDLAEDRILHLGDIAGTAWGGAVLGRADVDLTDPEQPGFDIEAKASGIEANDVISSVTPASGIVFGKMDLASSFSGRGATPEQIARALTGSGNFTATDGQLAATPTTQAIWQALHLGEESVVPFRDLAAAFQVREGRIFTDGVELHGGNAAWKASGSLGFDGQLDYRVQVELDDRLSDIYRKRLGGELARLLANDSGRLALDFALSGPAAKPQVTVDTSKLAERAKQNLGNALRGRLDQSLKQGVKQLFGGGTTAPGAADSSGDASGGQ
ncbi:MAG: hypothetical protein ACT4PE_06545 [Candidatus Eiseniibacteriota bacterium]